MLGKTIYQFSSRLDDPSSCGNDAGSGCQGAKPGFKVLKLFSFFIDTLPK
jgi:hypothetical protein